MIVPAFEPAPADSDGGVKTNPSDVPVPDRMPLHLWVKGLEPRLLVSLVRFEAPPHDLHVLLRHRARSISRKYLLPCRATVSAPLLRPSSGVQRVDLGRVLLGDRLALELHR